MSASGSGGGARRPQPDQPDDDEHELVLHEEQANVATRWEGGAYGRIRRKVTHENVSNDYPVHRDRLVQERVAAVENDSGKIETLPDGSISIPLFEEELVVTKRTVLRERVIIRKETLTAWETVETELRRETISVDADDAPPPIVDAADDE